MVYDEKLLSHLGPAKVYNCYELLPPPISHFFFQILDITYNHLRGIGKLNVSHYFLDPFLLIR